MKSRKRKTQMVRNGDCALDGRVTIDVMRNMIGGTGYLDQNLIQVVTEELVGV